MIDSWVWDWVWAGPCYRGCTRATNDVTGNCYQDILASFFYSGRKRSWSLVGHTLTPAAVLVSGTIGSPHTQCSSHRCLQRDPAQNLPEKPQQPQRAVWLDETIHITFTGLKWRFMWRLSWFSWKTTSVISCFRFLNCAQQKHWNIISHLSSYWDETNLSTGEKWLRHKRSYWWFPWWRTKDVHVCVWWHFPIKTTRTCEQTDWASGARDRRPAVVSLTHTVHEADTGLNANPPTSFA